MGDNTNKSVVIAKSSGLVVGTGTRKKHPWRFVAAMAGVAVLALAVGGGTRWVQQYREDHRAASPKVVANKVIAAQNIANAGNYKDAQKQLAAALDNPELGPDERYAIIFQQGLTYENQKQYDEAIAAYKKAEAIKSTMAVAEAIGRTAAAKGDKALAITYYKKAITLVSPARPTADDDKKAYGASIAELGGTL